MKPQTQPFSVNSTVVQPDVLSYYPITEQDYDILVEGSGSAAESTARDVSLGIFFTALVGVIGILATTDLSAGGEVKWKPLVLTVFLAFATVTAAVLGAFFSWRVRRNPRMDAYRKLRGRIDRCFRQDGGTEQR